MKWLSPLDLSQNEFRNAVLQNLASAPSAPKYGQLYWSTTSSIPYVWNGTAWRPMDAAGLTDGSIQITALAVNPLARANHTGTQLAATISDLAGTVQGYRLDQFAVPTSNISMNGQRITTLSDPTSASDAATKNYVDTSIQQAAAGIDSKASVRALATANIATLSGTTTVDGVALAAGDRLLLTGQTTASQNGVYVIASGAWSRAIDADQTGEITPGAFWFVEEGTSYGKTQWRCNNTGTITIGSTAITIVQFGAASMYAAGNGLTLTGTVFSVTPVAGGGILVGAGGVQIDTTIVARKFSATITGDGTTSAFAVNPGLGVTDLVVFVKDSSGNQVLVDVLIGSASSVTVTFGTAPANGTTYRLTIVG